jgi:hypothetical protein
MLSRLRVRSSIAAGVLFAALAAAPVAAQEQPTEFQTWRLPGWTFTPGVTVGALFDNNVAISPAAVPGGKPASDKLFTLQPFGQLEYYDARTMFSSGYHGTMRRYVELSSLDGIDQRGYFTLRRMVSRRVTLSAKNNFMRVPTTDQLELNGVPFRRSGALYNDAVVGLDARLSRTMDFTASYENTWVDFVRKDTRLTGGFVNGAHASLSRRFSGRSSIGVEGGIRVARLTETAPGPLLTVEAIPVTQPEAVSVTQLYEDAGAVYRYRTGPLTVIEAAFGVARLDDRTRDVTRNGPYARAGVTHRADRATVGAFYERRYVPSLAFGGANQSEEVRGYVQMPLARNRFYVQESAAWRRTNPFVGGEPPLASIWVNTLGGYSLQRWLRLEGYWVFTRQDTRLPGGLISRHVIGAQFVLSEPVRIR